MLVRVHADPASEAPLLELAERLREGLAALAPVEGGREVDLIVAPHRAYAAVREAGGFRAVAKAAQGRVHLVTSSPGEPAFAREVEAAAMGAGALALAPAALRALQSLGIPARLLPMAWDAGLVSPEASGSRSIDVAFLGTLTPRRERLLAALSEALPEVRLEILARDPHEPLLREQPGHVWGGTRAAYMGRTRIVLDLSPEDEPQAGWLRWAAAIHAGAVVVAERGCEPPAEHAVLTAPDDLAQTLAALLADPARCEAIASAARAALQGRGALAAALREAVGALDNGKGGWQLARLRARLWARAWLDSEAGRFRRWAVSRLSRVPRRWLPVSKAHVDAVLYEARLEWETLYRRQALAERDVTRRLQAFRVLLREGVADAVTIAESEAFGRTSPGVSVVVATYNHAGVLGEALDSVFASRGVQAEVIVVDDASTDGTAAMLTARLAARPEQPVRVVTHRSNRGLSAARNTGFAQARTEWVFVLDGDDRLLPEALAQLASALEAQPGAAFSYGLLRRFGAGKGLVSAYPWRLPQLLRHNVIAAAAMVRRSAWEAVGGYRPEMDAEFGGMEDWALWLAFAERGWHGAHVPRVLVEYRTTPGSMSRTMVLNYRLTDGILARFPGLAAAVASTPRPGRPDGG